MSEPIETKKKDLAKIALRLRELRKSRGETQVVFAKIGGVSKSSQIAYEMGRTLPSVPYLKKLALAGVNVVYLLTGKELTPIDPDGQLRSLIDSWLRLAPENRDALEQYAGFLVVTTTDSVETPEEAEKWLRESDKVLHALREGRPIPDPS